MSPALPNRRICGHMLLARLEWALRCASANQGEEAAGIVWQALRPAEPVGLNRKQGMKVVTRHAE